MQTLIPQSASATARPVGRFGRALRFGLTPLGMALFIGGVFLAAPAFWHPRAIWIMLAWDVLVLLLWLMDALLLPSPKSLTITRSFLDSPQLGQPTRIELAAKL